ncbi:protein SPT2 homolog [Procambarus clarkii]|uniref:protein SPT2 homolog n=1 Tax=Procambarus clarkii TaxID=6728 RepID=UPI001E673586|nr:probable GPI-anchored adhesin-like protein PGA18 [Procambarus clarkii]
MRFLACLSVLVLVALVTAAPADSTERPVDDDNVSFGSSNVHRPVAGTSSFGSNSDHRPQGGFGSFGSSSVNPSGPSGSSVHRPEPVSPGATASVGFSNIHRPLAGSATFGSSSNQGSAVVPTGDDSHNQDGQFSSRQISPHQQQSPVFQGSQFPSGSSTTTEDVDNTAVVATTTTTEPPRNFFSSLFGGGSSSSRVSRDTWRQVYVAEDQDSQHSAPTQSEEQSSNLEGSVPLNLGTPGSSSVAAPVSTNVGTPGSSGVVAPVLTNVGTPGSSGVVAPVSTKVGSTPR